MQGFKKTGFTLVEIMIVVAIVALLAALSVPNIVRAKISANESAAESTLKTISIACESFRAAQAVPSYPANDAALTGATPPYVDVTVFGVCFASGIGKVYTSSAPRCKLSTYSSAS